MNKANLWALTSSYNTNTLLALISPSLVLEDTPRRDGSGAPRAGVGGVLAHGLATCAEQQS